MLAAILERYLERLRREPPLGEDTKVYEKRGTPYPVTQKEIDDIQDRHKSFRPPRHYISKCEACKCLTEAHAPGVHLDRHQLAAMDRLQALGKLSRWGSDIAIKVFNDLDKIFFMGVLRGHVYLRWSDKSEHADWGGVTCYSPDRRLMIQLSTKILKSSRASLRDVWAVLLHEMIHAYLRHQCGPTMRDDDPYSPPGHGRIFQACMKAVQYRIGSPKLIKLELGHSIPTRPSWYTKGGYRRNGAREGHHGHRDGDYDDYRDYR